MSDVIKPMHSINDFHSEVERNVLQSISEAYEHDQWDEDYMSRSMLINLRKGFQHIKIEEGKPGKINQCRWNIYKNSGKIEYKYGDIAILVQLHFDQHAHLEGVAFLEAKRYYHQNRKFSKMDFNQLARMCSLTAHHRTLLFDFYTERSMPIAVTLPSPHLLSLKNKSRSIYVHTESFADCLIHRYLRGFELDFRPSVVDGVKGVSAGHIGVENLFVIQAAMQPGIEIQADDLGLNIKNYQVIDAGQVVNNQNFESI